MGFKPRQNLTGRSKKSSKSGNKEEITVTKKGKIVTVVSTLTEPGKPGAYKIKSDPRLPKKLHGLDIPENKFTADFRLKDWNPEKETEFTIKRAKRSTKSAVQEPMSRQERVAKCETCKGNPPKGVFELPESGYSGIKCETCWIIIEYERT